MSRIDELIAELAPRGVEVKALGEVGKFIRGNGLQKADLRDAGFPAVHYGQIHTHYGVWATETKSFTDENIAVKLRHARPGDLLIATTSEDDDAVAKATAWLGNTDVALSGDAYIYRHELEPKYMSYFFQSTSFQDQKRRFVSGTKVRRVSGDSLAKIRIPVPPLEVQREIVRVLDQFTQLEAELEAELEARRRQNEHYLHAAVLPDGDLEWTTLGDATTNHDRRRKPVTRSDRKEGEFPYYGANGIQDYVHDFIFDGTFLLVGEDGSVKNADGTPVLNWASGKIWVNNHAHVLTASSEQFSLRYLYYYLATVDVTAYVTGGTQPKINQKNLNSIPVPVIARDFQDRVVEILDRFDALVNDLSVGLPAELAARRKQYEYYRDKLLTFEEAAA